MRSLFRPCLSILLVVLLTMWGTCPCVYAKMLDIAPPAGEQTSVEAQGTPSQAPACCCCKVRVSVPTASEGAGEAPPPSRGCPCCKRGEWMRDLPPQAHALMLDVPAPAAFDLPCVTLTELVLDLVGQARAAEPGPSPSQRPHASPVGIVRLLN